MIERLSDWNKTMNAQLDRDVPFLRTKDAFESSAGPTLDQKVRGQELFIRGELSAEELARVRTDRDGFELVVGRSNFLPAVFLENGVNTSRATCLIRTSGVDFRGRRGAWTGTGFLVARNILLTNHHVLNSVAVASAGNAVFNYQLGLDGLPSPTRTFRLRPDQLFLTSPAVGGLDYTFCGIEEDTSESPFLPVRIDRGAFTLALKEFANIVSHPDGRLKEVVLHENEVVWQDDLVVHYTADTEPGSSGAAVCNNNWQLVALHHASKETNDPKHPILNEGIKLSAIAADLERLSRTTTASAAVASRLLTIFGGLDERLGFFGGLGRRLPSSKPIAGPEAVVDSFTGTEADIDVGFWNVEWLTKHYETKKEAVAKVIAEMRLDLWCLEESSPNASEAVAQTLQAVYNLDYGSLAAEPESSDGKQSCTVLWNRDTLEVEEIPWGEPIETWLAAKSTDFDELSLDGFEAVHGRIFDRYPALFRARTVAAGPDGTPFEFYVVPLHLKAKDEGSLRRRMASKIIAAAIQKKIEGGLGRDFIVGGDANAPLASEDFADLTSGSMIAVSAEDAEGGAFSYLKGPKSLIDHIFLSPNLAARYGSDDFYVVAAEKTFPNYLAQISDHRPVLLRMSMAAPAIELESARTTKPKKGDPLAELKKRLAVEQFEPEARRRRRPPSDAPTSDGSTGTGYDPAFLGANVIVPLPGLPSGTENRPAIVNKRLTGLDRFVLTYTHFSVVMNADRRLPFYSAVNIDGRQLRKIPRGDSWFLDPRIGADEQIGDSVYKSNDLDRGHMTRRLDPVWGSPEVAAKADADTFCFTNACPQHKNLNQKEWLKLEDYVLSNAATHDLRVSVITGPVLRKDDAPYRGIKLPREFWKIVAMVRKDTRKLSVTGYMLSQRDMISGFEFVFGEFKTYQVRLSKIQELTGLSFGDLLKFDPLARPGFETASRASAVEIEGAENLVL
jgi:DNA/RNA endonuclease G (NUC1)/endonuclease/exonuclease/phosphatase family metal-dependent hydrolase